MRATKDVPRSVDAERHDRRDAIFYEAGNKPAVLQTMARVLRLARIEDAENGYNALVSVYTNDMRPKVEGVKKIHSILARTNPKLQKL